MEPDALWYPDWDRLSLEDEALVQCGDWPPGRRLILPCTFLDYGGIYEYVLTDVCQARRWLLAGPAACHISHPMLWRALFDVIGFMIPPPEKGPLPSLVPADDVLVFQVEQYETLVLQSRGNSKQIRELVEKQRYTFGMLKRLC